MAVQTYSISQAGKAELVFHPTAPLLYLASPDGTLKTILLAKPDETLEEIKAPDGPDKPMQCVAISAAGDLLLTGGDTLTAHVWAIGAAGRQITHSTIAGRCTSPVRSVALTADGQFALILSDDPVIRLRSLVAGTVTVLRAHEGGGRGAAFDPRGTYFVTIGWEGNLCLWDLATASSPICTLSKFLPRHSDPATGIASGPHWAPDGSLVAVPSPSGVKIFARPTDAASIESWAAAFTLGHKDTVLVRFSPNGQYLASVDANHQVEIWSLASRESVDRHRSNHPLHSIAWAPAANLICFVDNSTALSVWDKPVAPSLVAPFGAVSPTDATLPTPVVVATPAKSLIEYAPPVKAAEKVRRDDEEELVVEDDDEAPRTKKTKHRSQLAEDGESSADENQRRIAELRKSRRKHAEEMQAAFQPGAYGDAKRKVLCWNPYGRVIRVEHEAGRASLELTLTLQEGTRTIKEGDRLNFGMCSVSADLVALASEVQLMVRPVVQWNSPWSSVLAGGEHITCVAAGARAVAVGTTAGVLRLWSATGHQLATLRAPRLVALAAAGDMLAVLSNTPGGGKTVQILHMFRVERLVEVTCPVVGSGAVRWIGFSAKGLLLLQDTEGVVSALSGSLWHPVQNVPPEHFVLYAHDNVIMTANCMGAHHPAVTPLPPIEARALELPFVATDTTAGRLAEQHARDVMLWVAELDAAINNWEVAKEGPVLLRRRAKLEQNTLVKLITTALAEEKMMRAIDLTQMLKFPLSLQLAFRAYLEGNSNTSSTEFIQRLDKVKGVVMANGLRLAEACHAARPGAPANAAPAAAAEGANPSDVSSSPAKTLPLPLTSKITVADQGAQSPDEDEVEPQTAVKAKSAPAAQTKPKARAASADVASPKKKPAAEKKVVIEDNDEKKESSGDGKKRKVANPFAVPALARGTTVAGKQLTSVLGQLDKQ